MYVLHISLWDPANPLFVRDKYVTPTGKRLYAGYAQKRKYLQKAPLYHTARNKQHVRAIQ